MSEQHSTTVPAGEHIAQCAPLPMRAEIRQAVDMLIEGKPAREIAKQIGVTTERVRQVARKYTDLITAEKARRAGRKIDEPELKMPLRESAQREVAEAVAEAMGVESGGTPAAQTDRLTTIAAKLACALGDLAVVAWELGEALKREAGHAEL